MPASRVKPGTGAFPADRGHDRQAVTAAEAVHQVVDPGETGRLDDGGKVPGSATSPHAPSASWKR